MSRDYDRTKKIIPIVCMPITLNILRFFIVFPPKNKEVNPGARFFLKFFLVWIFSTLPWASSVLHFIKTIQSKEYNHTELDITYAVSFTSTFGLIWAFIIKIKSAGQMYTFLSDFNGFGKPTDFDRSNETFNRYAKIHFVYLESLVWVIMLTSNVFKKETCRHENQMYNLTEVCGLFTYTWTPFNIDYTPVKEIYMVIQMFGVHQMYMLAGLMAWQVFETMQHIVIRIRHVKHVFVEALSQTDHRSRRNMFNFAIRYHTAVLGLEEKLNDAFAMFMFTHMLLTAAILGSGIFSFFHARSFSTFMVCTGWFWGLFMDCFSGQRLQDESLDLGAAVYNSPWYDYEDALKKDLLFVVKKCQTPMKLRAGPFGIMDRVMFLAVLKVTYSYITLLQKA